MDESQRLVQFPEPSETTLILLALTLAAAFAFVVLREIAIRRRARRRRLSREWESIAGILKERRIDGPNATLLESLIRRASKNEPLRAVTTREGFETIVEAELARQSDLDSAAFEALGVTLRALRRELGLDYVPIGHAIRSTRELHEGQWMTMGSGAGSPPEWIRVMVEDLNEAFFYVMLKDAAGAKAPSLPAGTRVQCILWRDEDARYGFETTVASFEPSPPLWRLHHTSSLERSQSRADFRVRYDQPIVAGVLNAPIDGDTANAKPRAIVTRISGRITSISAGGCALVFSQPVARHVLLRIPLEVPGARAVEVDIQIVATAAISGGRHLVRGRFLGLSEDMRDKIARYVLHKQQQRLAAQSIKGG